jgi:hypothetical protein
LSRTVYFDRNVFDHIGRKLGITDEEIELLRKEISDGRLCILVSVETVIETVNARQDTALAGLRLMKDLGRQILPIKSHTELLRDDICNFANGKDLESPFFQGMLSIDRLIADVENQKLKEVIAEEKRNKERLNENLRVEVEFERKALNGKRPANFENYWETRSMFYGETLAHYAGCLAQCQARGIHELLEVRSVRMAVGGYLSLMYSLLIEGHTVHKGTSYDLMHTAPMSAAGIIVTNDRELQRLVGRIPIHDLRLMSLQELIEMI